jgi:drug/metabolite transporter (DMT)-like permease
VATPVLFVSVPVSSFLGHVIWQQKLDTAEIIGVLLVVSGVIISVLKRSINET